MKKSENENRQIRFTVRVNEKEAKWLREAAWREKRSVAEFIRNRALGGELPKIPASTEDLIRQLTYEINKVGVNINQIARSSNMNGYQTGYEKRKLEEDMKVLLELRELVFELVRGTSDGDNETPAP